MNEIAEKLSAKVDRQLDEMAEKKLFDAAQDALGTKDLKTELAGFAALAGGMCLDGVSAKVDGVKAHKHLKIGAAAVDLDAIKLWGRNYAAGMGGKIQTKATVWV